jgi:hypothetical protein
MTRLILTIICVLSFVGCGKESEPYTPSTQTGCPVGTYGNNSKRITFFETGSFAVEAICAEYSGTFSCSDDGTMGFNVTSIGSDCLDLDPTIQKGTESCSYHWSQGLVGTAAITIVCDKGYLAGSKTFGI